jgi:hypothetical protein
MRINKKGSDLKLKNNHPKRNSSRRKLKIYAINEVPKRRIRTGSVISFYTGFSFRLKASYLQAFNAKLDGENIELPTKNYYTPELKISESVYRDAMKRATSVYNGKKKNSRVQ